MAQATSVVLVGDGRRLSAIDPVTGSVPWRQDVNPGAHASAVAGPPGLVYTSITAADGSITKLFVVSLASATPVLIGQVPGQAIVKAIAPDGTRLYLLQFVARASGDPLLAGQPTTLLDLPIPEPWRGAASRSTIFRDLGGGIVSPDGQWWYGLQATREGETTTVELRMMAFQQGGAAITSSLRIPTQYSYFSLLLAPDGRTLYAVDYRTAETIHVIDASQHTLVRSVAMRREGSKAPACAATLSPEGDRLYVIGRDGSEGDGIDVIDTASLRRIAHFLPRRNFYCLAIAPNGRYLYASSSSTSAGSSTTALTALDVQTGNELQTVHVGIDGVGSLVLVATAN